MPLTLLFHLDEPVRIEGYVNGVLRKLKKKGYGEWAKKFKFSQDCDGVVVELFIVFPPKENQLMKHMSSVLKSGEMADVTFIVKGQHLPAHQVMVATASTVLAGMFEADKFKNGSSKIIELNDEEPENFRQLLSYIYTGDIPRNEQDSAIKSLFLAADKYLIKDLKIACERKMILKITLENVIQFLVLSYLHSAAELMKASLKFISKYRNEGQKRPEWNEILNMYPDLHSLVSQRLFNEHCAICDEAHEKSAHCRQKEEDSDDSDSDDSDSDDSDSEDSDSDDSDSSMDDGE